MRNSTERFIAALQRYLKSSISDRVMEANIKDPDIHLPDIALWQSGYNGVLSGLSNYPGCIILVNGKTLTDPYTTSYSVVIGIGLTADDPAYLETMGRCYEDILEDAIRSDWSLGGAVLDTDIGVKFESDCTSNVYLIQAQLTCQVDLGGYVYQAGDEIWRKELKEKAAGFFGELSQDAISGYLLENSAAVMAAFGINKESGSANIASSIYDTLQGGDTVSAEMNDGGMLRIYGHFDEGGTDYWNIKIEYEVPAEGTNRCFDEGSLYSVKDGKVILTASPAEITDTAEYDMALCVYAYTADITDVSVSDGKSDFVLSATGLSIAENYDKPCLIDPNGATYTISVHDFRYPENGSLMIDGEAFDWAEIQKEIRK